MNRKISYLLLITGIIFLFLTAGCVQLNDARLLMEFTDHGDIYTQDIASYAASEARLLGVNFSESEITSRAAELAKKYSGSYDKESDQYVIDWNAFHLSIGRAYDLTDDEIRRYVPASTRPNVYGYHNLPVPEGIYNDVLDPKHKAVA
ncbi:hypothetical protein McpSp1_16120 [Methanocorpusculaceae archaeon Sp1]|nr:hypothetical protein [Methanocorpusculaceae archaeon Sp1]